MESIEKNIVFFFAANITVDELMTHLIQAVEVFREQQQSEITEEVRYLMKYLEDSVYPA